MAALVVPQAAAAAGAVAAAAKVAEVTGGGRRGRAWSASAQAQVGGGRGGGGGRQVGFVRRLNGETIWRISDDAGRRNSMSSRSSSSISSDSSSSFSRNKIGRPSGGIGGGCRISMGSYGLLSADSSACGRGDRTASACSSSSSSSSNNSSGGNGGSNSSARGSSIGVSTSSTQSVQEEEDTSLTELELNRWRQKPVEERYRIVVERNIGHQRKRELGVDHWSAWATPGPCAYRWEWRADEQVFITQGTLRVTPDGCTDSAVFHAGDLVRFPKWFLAELEFEGAYEQRYRFRAYGDDN